uniref:RNA polymerase III subunit Rpc25 domain-containing protein n=1 Tax=Cyclophora tenuis TaxID=216820 RepID=A0A7S1D3G6_CYCTE|mmetsp:Transcript_1864/g.3269  ORF Transcript_1864/g.3269 Transcript_1864/m.3269 type:complete len:333 (+) Transcript_1864:203-1201(+)|eukprot:CAMPEP_0116557896 /NCGR_PEP_ID=MMETSP0397-20121206/9506_1 /TAXON_ID=216820 /ORGANISM="Cyclophora tenuis, Strain ECT3854" /LENGTH=332 /DNA_ID=CAMNT_0004083427 /DNA_START=160 /DNA_END=1158 /DNA_ORIENTATION=+
MFALVTVADTVRIAPSMFAQPTLVSVHGEMDKKYPNMVIMDVGLVICRYGDVLQIGDGVIAAGDGGAHHEVIARFVVFRPFVEEVCIGSIVKSTEEGIQVSLGFFEDIFVPAYWMLRPSHYEQESGLWVWTPNYDDDEAGEEPGDEAGGEAEVKDESAVADIEGVKAEPGEGEEEVKGEEEGDENAEDGGDEENRFEMHIGAEIRFKVKSINFTQVTNTAKGVQATTTTTSHSIPTPRKVERTLSVGSAADSSGRVRKRSTSVDLSDADQVPASMSIIASICEDGLGLTSWWENNEEEEGEEEGGEGEAQGEGEEPMEEHEESFFEEPGDYY